MKEAEVGEHAQKQYVYTPSHFTVQQVGTL